MLEYRVGVAMDLFEAAVASSPIETRPLGWAIRRLRKII